MGGAKTQKNKAHKTKFASKSSRNAHKVAGGGLGASKGPGKPAMRAASNGQRAKDLRLQRNKNIREHKRAALLAEKRASSGASSSPRILAVVALSSNVSVDHFIKQLISSASQDETAENAGRTGDGDFMDAEESASRKSDRAPIGVPRYKLRLSVLEAPRDDLQACLEVSKVADVIAFATSASEDGRYVDDSGRLILSMLRKAGLPNTIGVVMGLRDVPLKRRSDMKKAALAALQIELPETKCFSADGTDDLNQIMRHLAEQRPSGPLWRSERPYIVTQEAKLGQQVSDTVDLLLSGYVRGRGLSVNQLVHLAGVGDCQCSQIEVLEDPYPLRQQHKVADSSKMDFLMDEENSDGNHKRFVPDSSLQDPLIVENVPDPLAGEQTWPTEEELPTAGQGNGKRVRKRLPKGTSEYQASWITEDPGVDEDDLVEDGHIMAVDMRELDDDDDEEEESSVSEDDQISHEGDGLSSKTDSVWKDDEDTQSEMMDDEELTPTQRAEERRRLQAAHDSNAEFPDEVDTPTDSLARERFAKYRGLKSFRNSPWDPKESLPPDYARIFAFDNFQRTRKHVVATAADIDRGEVPGCVSINTYVRLHIKDVPLVAATNLLQTYDRVPVVACGLLQHESKMSLLHFSISKHDGYSEPVKSKEELIFHTGFRHYKARPIFSCDAPNLDKQKFERFLPSGQFAMASVFAPVSFPPALPLIVFKEGADGVKLVASGSLRSVDPDRIILKRIVLSGFPHKVSKRKAVVKFLFQNPEDVRWFRPVELWTKYGRRGRIKEPVGTHGSMKCVFDGVLQQRDAVCLNLYKRVYPKWSVR